MQDFENFDFHEIGELKKRLSCFQVSIYLSNLTNNDSHSI